MLPTFRRFSQADVPTAPNWIASIFNPLNVFCEQTVQTLNKNLVIGQNVQGQKFVTSFTTPADYATGGFNSITFQYTGGGQPNCCMIGTITRADGTAILAPTSVGSWFLNINTSPYTATIDYISGLIASTKYNVTLVVI